jgi:Asp-tRNA(Asn)/Glu-tRNA(Gln) amidotransferase A subunit family amidase
MSSAAPKSNAKDLIDASALWLANAIRRREVSSEEVVRAFLQRLRRTAN